MTTNSPNPHSKEAILNFNSISEHGQLKLVDLTFKPFVLAISTVPFFAFSFVIWAYRLEGNIIVLLAWGSFYMLLAIGIHKFYILYKKDRNKNNHALTVTKWLPIINGVALTHGVAMTLPFVILIDKATFEFNVVYLLSVAVGNFAFAAHLSPVPKAFYYTFIPCLLIILALMPWTFPNQWVILFFSALFILFLSLNFGEFCIIFF